MITNTSLLTISDAPAAYGAYDAAKVLGAIQPDDLDVKEATVAPRKKPDRMAWVNHLVSIRDQKDRAAFAEVFAHFAPRVKAFLMKSGTSPDMAEEVAQDVMATLWRKSHLFDPTKASVSTWIFTIARNRRIDMLRRQRRPEPEDLTWGPEPEPDQADVLALQQDSAKLGEALATLPEKQRDLIVKAYYGELTHSEIADATGLPLGTIKSRIRLALNRLRHQMK
jgi:RNA polymerase sigma factor (sigma-70 family)